MQQHARKPASSTGTPSGGSGASPNHQARGNAAAAEQIQVKAGNAPGTPEVFGGGGAGLPFVDRIQASFGHHDISDVEAVVGGTEGKGAKQMGAHAYASGNTIVFTTNPDLHTAAHEAAHVVQQRAGISLPGGKGKAGDRFEKAADEVADLVVKGESAEGALDRMVGKTSGKQQAAGDQVQMLPEKKVGSGAMRRIEKAREAINHTKEVFAFGAGNQLPALQSSNFNSYFRMKAMRDPGCWEMTASARMLASQNPDALTAAKADLAKGGNCGEHAQLGFDYLRATMKGETINRCDKEGLDHAFVIMGDISSEADNQLAVCDPWPHQATACLWEDHFAHTTERKELNVRKTEKADGKDVKSVIAAGLKLSQRGLAMIEQKYTDEESKEEIKKGTSREDGAHPWIWNHGPTNQRGAEYDYVEEEKPQ